MTNSSVYRVLVVMLAAGVAAGGSVWAQPAVVATAEGQVGETPAFAEKVGGARFESIPGALGEILLGGVFASGFVPTPPPNFDFVTDVFHGTPMPVQVDSRSSTFDDVFKQAPTSAPWLGPSGVAGVFAYTEDGTDPGTQGVVVAIVPTPPGVNNFVILDNIPTFPDPSVNDVGVAADNQGRITVVFTELPPGMPPEVKAQRLDGITGLPIGGATDVLDSAFNVDVALLDPAGDRLVIPATDFNSIRGAILDTTGATPQVLPEFPINTTPAIFANVNPAVAADPATGAFTVAWENISGLQGDPVNIRARRFDAQGNPVGDDFVVNTTTANAQGQQSVAYGAQGTSVIVWAGDGVNLPQDALDVFAQAYDASGQPIGGEIRVNTVTDDIQDRPQVRFLPQPDAQGRPQFAVLWRDVGDDDGGSPRGTGLSYKCFSIDGLQDPAPIFEDGFESGDTTSWSTKVPQ